MEELLGLSAAQMMILQAYGVHTRQAPRQLKPCQLKIPRRLAATGFALDWRDSATAVAVIGTGFDTAGSVGSDAMSQATANVSSTRATCESPLFTMPSNADKNL